MFMSSIRVINFCLLFRLNIIPIHILDDSIYPWIKINNPPSPSNLYGNFFIVRCQIFSSCVTLLSSIITLDNCAREIILVKIVCLLCEQKMQKGGEGSFKQFGHFLQAESAAKNDPL